MTDRDTLLSCLEKGELCLGRKYLDKDVSPWRGFGLGKSQKVELSYEGFAALDEQWFVDIS